ncbi:nucleotidyl transferase AbiEii/AbiGii toxin family protein [Infirmifilum sp. SLHALR2]|nr:MAG: hypothetical protein B7L53_00200 [Thermofilum sp. NZ13]
MLGREDVLRLARARGLRAWQEEKRYVQALLFYSLRRLPLVAKGGTYLWLFHGLNRFSEDLDFTQVGEIEPGDLEEVRLSLELFGVRSTLKVLEDDRFTLTFRVDARGPLATSDKDLCRVRVDISRREPLRLPPIQVVLDEPFYGIPIIFLKGMDLREVLAEKIRAALVRGEARDVYDAWFLIRKGVELDASILSEKLAFYGLEWSPSLCGRLTGIGGNWAKVLKPIVFGSVPEFSSVLETVFEALGCT